MASRAPRTGAEVVAPGPPTVMAVAPAPKTAAPEERRSLPSPESPPAPRVAELPSAPVEADSDVEVHAPRSAGWRPVYQPAAALDRERLDAAAGRIDASVDAARRAGTPRLKIPIK
jgi:hypothetical protein